MFDPKNYPPDWHQLGKLVRERAGNKCEICGVPNGAIGQRDRYGEWHDERSIHCMNSDVGAHLFAGDFPAMVKIVLTVHHACTCDKKTCRDISRWQLLCQKHHLNADRPHHLAVQKANREAKKRQAQPELFG